MPESHSTHPNVTPLIDVVMCLIIFFMLVAKIGVNTGADPSITIPVTQLGSELKDLGNTLMLNVREVADEPFVTALVDKSSTRPQEMKLVDTVTEHAARCAKCSSATASTANPDDIQSHHSRRQGHELQIRSSRC